MLNTDNNPNTGIAMATLASYPAAALPDLVGRVFGEAAPIELDQQRIDGFARCTGDDQWIRVDVERARSESPFGSTIAHGLLLLALIPVAQYELGVYPSDARSVLNYGLDKVRFLAPVTAGTQLVIRVELSGVESRGDGRYLVRCTNTAFDAANRDRKVMVADTLGLVLA